ncbi:hypothetical protein E2P47_02230, partial [Candidatus Bathyarchaeota archaeon]
MRSYFSAIIDKSDSFENSKLLKRLQNDLKGSLSIPRSNINYKEHNTFLFIGATKSLSKPLTPQIIKQTELRLKSRLDKYYLNNNLKLKKSLKNKQELKETAHIVKEFLKEIDNNLPKEFDIKLGKVISEVPDEYYNLQRKSLISFWRLDEEHKIQFLLPGWKSTFTLTKY